jgi:hypothetical protein
MDVGWVAFREAEQRFLLLFLEKEETPLCLNIPVPAHPWWAMWSSRVRLS